MNTLLLLLLTVSRFETNQGQGQNDGGVAWQVTCTNCSGGGGSSSDYIGFDAGYVSVANFPTTQAVSLASVPTHAVTLASTTITGTSAVSIASMPSTPVTGSFFQATQPVSLASAPTTPVTGTFFQATQPVSGTVTANAGTGTLAVSIATAPALVASSAVIGHVISDTTSTTAVTQATGTNLHVVLDTTSTTAVTQATGTNLHAVLDTTSTTAVTQATGTNLHAVLDTTSTTACTQATGTNLHVVTDSTSSLAANQSVNVSQINAVTPLMGNGVTGTGSQRVTISSDNTAFTVNARTTGNGGAIFDAPNNGTAPAQVTVIGAQLQSSATATAGTAGQVGNVVAGLDHVLFSRFGGPVSWSCFVEAVTVTTQCQAAPAAGLKLYVTGIECSNEAATVQGIDVVYGTGVNCVTVTTALTHKFQMGTLATTTSPIVVGANFQSPLQPAAANAICLRPTAATAFGCTLTGFTAP